MQVYRYGAWLLCLVSLFANSCNSVRHDANNMLAGETGGRVENSLPIQQLHLTAEMLIPSWKVGLKDEFSKPYMAELELFLNRQFAAGHQVLPEAGQYFAALNAAPLEKVKVVILGQDPYPTPGNPHGLSFSVQPGVPVPASLANIFKEQKSDLGILQPAGNGYLMPWAQQGVLLLNSVLTVEAHAAGSHRGRGWENFSDKIISLLNQQQSPVVFLLWGSFAQAKAGLIDNSRHLVLKAAHPSPLSARNGFFGCRHFSKANAFLVRNGLPAIDWQLPALPVVH